MSIVDTIFIYFIQCTIHGHFKHLFVLVFYCFQTRNVVVDQCGGNCAYRRAEARHQWPKKESQGECQSINVKEPDPHLFGIQDPGPAGSASFRASRSGSVHWIHQAFSKRAWSRFYLSQNLDLSISHFIKLDMAKDLYENLFINQC